MMTDPFEVLGLEPTIVLDRKTLDARHRELSKQLHPDRFIGKPSAERRAALGKAIEVNEAHRTLRDPVRRASAFAKRRGVELKEGEHQADPELLMEMMEVREELSAAHKAGDLDKLHALTAKHEQRQRALLERLGAALGPAERAPDDETQAIAHLSELRYVGRLLSELRDLVADLEDQ